MQLRMAAASTLFLWSTYCFAGANCNYAADKVQADGYNAADLYKSAYSSGAGTNCEQIHRYMASLIRLYDDYRVLTNCVQASRPTDISGSEAATRNNKMYLSNIDEQKQQFNKYCRTRQGDAVAAQSEPNGSNLNVDTSSGSRPAKGETKAQEKKTKQVAQAQSSPTNQARQLGAPQQKPPTQQAAGPPADANSARAQQGNCSTITGTGGGPGPTNCTQINGTPASLQGQINQSQASLQGGTTPPRVVVLPPPQCNMCDVLKTVGEVLPDFAEKLDNIKLETINDVGPPVFDGGPNTLHPFLPPSPLAPVTDQQDPLDAINDMKDIANDAKALSDLTDENNEPEDYAEKCKDGFLDAAWKAFIAKGGSYAANTKAARDSLKECLKAAAKHIEDTLSNGGADSNSLSGDN